METSTPKQKVKQQQLALFVASFELHHSVGLLRYLDALPLIVEPHWGSIQSNCRNGGLDESNLGSHPLAKARKREFVSILNGSTKANPWRKSFASQSLFGRKS
jgi:hypothetical protein